MCEKYMLWHLVLHCNINYFVCCFVLSSGNIYNNCDRTLYFNIYITCITFQLSTETQELIAVIPG